MEALEQLKSVLCDPEGNVCISGSDGDRKVISDALESLEQQVAALTEELQKRDKCSYMGPMRDCPTHGIGPELSTAQAREAKLREAMLSDSALAGRFHKLLALPADDSALMERLAQERERVAQMILNGSFLHTEAPVAIWAREVAAAIRSMT